MNKFVVVILTKDKKSTRVANLSRLFPSDNYVLIIRDCIPPSSLVNTTTYSAQQQAETMCINNVLSECRTKYPLSYVTILEDTSVTTSTAEQIHQILIQATQQAGWELFYLCKWLDRCDLYGIPQNVKNKTYSFVNTLSPNGFQAIMFSPRGRDIILGIIPMKNGKLFPPVTQPIAVQLNNNISNGNITAISTIPNVFEYNVNLATNSADFQKGTLCQPVNTPSTSTTDQTALSFMWYIIMIIMIILLVVALWYLFGGNHAKKDKGEDYKS